MEDYPPGALVSRPFVEVLAQAIDEGRISVRRAAGLAGLTIEDLADLFHRHGIAARSNLDVSRMKRRKCTARAGPDLVEAHTQALGDV
jgi:hypothetical protein